MWEFSSKNSYPNIILHDCIMEKIRIENHDIVFEFDDSGFWVGKDHPQNQFGEILRTDKSEVRLTNIQFVFSSIHIHNELRFANKLLLTKRDEISFDDFATKLTSGKWMFEFVDEYYGYNSAMFSGYIGKKKKPYFTHAQIEIYYEESLYYWNKIYPDRTW